MNLKKLLIVFCLFFTVQCVLGQSMTDDQVVQFIMTQQEKGESQQSIVSKLLQKGVTVDQIRRIKKKYEAQQTQPGAVDLTGSTTMKPSVNRMRTNKEKALDKMRQDKGYMIQSQAELNEKPTKKMQANQLNDEIGFLDIDSLIYYQNYFKKTDNEVFGRNIFNNEMISFETSMNIPTPSNYRLGAGDVIIIDVWGATQQTISDTLSPDGTITVDGIGPLNLAGMTVSEANAYVKQKLGKFFAASEINLTVGDMRSIQVQVMGEVAVPGTYTLNALSTVFNALYTAGGISDIGSLRDIRVVRDGKEIARVDVYDYIMKEDAGRGYRRVVASPKPQEIIEIGTIRTMVNSGDLVIACGGGGIPVTRQGNHLKGASAVIDKDFASCLLAKELDADFLIILTAVEKAAINYGKPGEKWLDDITVEEAKQYIDEGHFAPGSMLPKVQAAVEFAESKPGRQALITLLEKARDGILGKTGTRIHL